MAPPPVCARQVTLNLPPTARMDIFDISALLLVVALAWLWLDSLTTRETAIAATKAACQSENLLLLDDTVAITRIGVARNDDGEVRLQRIYGFEYSDTGNNRRTGSLAMLGSRVLVVNLNLVVATPPTTMH